MKTGTPKKKASKKVLKGRHKMNDFYGNMTVGTKSNKVRVWNEELGFFEEFEAGMQPDS